MKQYLKILLAGATILGVSSAANAAPKQMENLTRGLVASNVGSGVLVSWRLLGTDDPATEFNLYRDGSKVASIKGSEGTNFLDKSGKVSSKYEIAAVVDGKEGSKSGVSVVLDQTVSNSGRLFLSRLSSCSLLQIRPCPMAKFALTLLTTQALPTWMVTANTKLS